MKRVIALSGQFFMITFLFSVVFLLRYQALCGNWNPLSPPQRIYYSGQTYDKNLIQAFIGNKKPVSLKWQCGRIDYSSGPWTDNDTDTIVLDTGNNTYITYLLDSGS